MKITLQDRQSMLIGDRRLINDSGHAIKLVVLHEKKPPTPVNVDRTPFPRKGEGNEVNAAAQTS